MPQLKELLRRRDPNALATAYKSAHDGLPEPLCAIWEPSAAPVLADYQAAGSDCPRKFLIRHGAHLLDLPDPRALDNVNTPEEYSQAVAALESLAPMQLKIQYYALMREQAGRSEETLETSAATPADLYTRTCRALRLYAVARAVEGGGQQRVQRLVAQARRQ